VDSVDDQCSLNQDRGHLVNQLHQPELDCTETPSQIDADSGTLRRSGVRLHEAGRGTIPRPAPSSPVSGLGSR
jgi:hypothetical protein